MANTPNLEMTYIDAAQSQKHITMNEALVDLDTMVQATALDKDLATPPGSPSEGDTYIVATGGTGDWVGKDNNLTTYYNGSWRFYVPKVGWRVYVADEAIYYLNDGTWAASPDISSVEGRVSALEERMGWVDYSDLATQTTPISLTTAPTTVGLTNDGLGPNTNKDHKIAAHGEIWDTTIDQFDWSSLSLGDTVDFRLDIEVTTTGANREIVTGIDMAIGGSGPYTLHLDRRTFKSAGTYQFVRFSSIYMGDVDTLNNPAKFSMSSDGSGDTVKVNGWYVRTLKR